MTATGAAARVCGLALAVVVGFGPTHLDSAQPRRVAIAGVVADAATGAPIPHALVRLGVYATWSNDTGWYDVAVVPGTYDVRVTASGFVGATAVGRLIGRSGLRLDMALPPNEPRAEDTEALARTVRAGGDPALAQATFDSAASPDRAASADRSPSPDRSLAHDGLQAMQAPPTSDVPAEIRVLMPDGSIVAMETDEYLKGVVPAEMGYVFQRAAEALKAQAIVARTYASRGCLRETAGDPAVCEPGLDANVDTTTRTQVWRPIHYDVSDAAVDATHGQALRYDGSLIPSLYFARAHEWTLASENSACCGGREWPFLKSESSPEAFAARWGHGAGMSQEGAAAFADWGATASEIVEHYYQGAILGAPSRVADDNETGQVAGATDGAPKVGAVKAGAATVPADAFDVPPGMPAEKSAKGIVVAPGRSAVVEGPLVEADFLFNAVGATVRAAMPGGAEILLDVRASRDGIEWTGWVPLEMDEHDSKQPSPVGENWTRLAMVRGRWLQARLTLRAPRAGTPTFEGITFHYLNADAGPAAPLSAHGISRMIPRSGWGADESLRFDGEGSEIWPASYTTPRAEVVHHTVTSNSPADPAAVVRAVYHYHAVTRGWGDVGYNFLIDHRGNAYEGRHGGERDGKITQGGHALQFNTNTIGVALLGTFTGEDERPTGEAMSALAEMLAAKAVRYGIEPSRSVVLADVTFPYGILGHRDVLPGHTACPGVGLHSQMADVRAAVERLMGSAPPPTSEPPPTAPPPAEPTTVPPQQPTTVPATPAPGCRDAVVAGDFEADDPAWTRSRAHLTRYDVFEGGQSLFIGLTSQDADDQTTWSSASQHVMIPEGTVQATLRFAVKTYGDADDRRLVRLLDSKGRVLGMGDVDLPPGEPWRVLEYDVSAALRPAVNTEVRLYFGVVNDGDGDRSHMRIDAVELEICLDEGGVSTATPPQVTPVPPTAPPATAPPTPMATPTLPLPPPEPEIVCGDLLDGAGTFEAALEGWHVTGNHAAAATQGASPAGGLAVRFAPAAGAEFGYAAVERNVVVPDDVVSATLGLWVRREAGAGALILELRRPTRGERKPLVPIEESAVTDEWRQVRVDLGAESLRHVRLYAGALGRGAGGVWVDGMTLDACWTRWWSAYLPASMLP